MTVRIRLEATDTAELDAHEAALRSVLTIDQPGSRDYPNRRRRPGPDAPGERARRYLDSAGVRAVPAGPDPAVSGAGVDLERVRRQLDTYRTIMSQGDVPFRQADAAAHALAGQVPALLGLASVGVGQAGTAPESGRSPLAAAEDAKRRRDIGAEIGLLRAADEDLQARPWFPLRPGDVVLMRLAADRYSPVYGETYLAVDGDTDIAGNAMLREVSRTPMPGGEDDEPEYMLRYDTHAGQWKLYAIDLYGVDPPPGTLTDPADLDAAQRWAGAEIARIREHGQITGWRRAVLRRDALDGYAPVFAPADDQDQERLTPFYDLWFEAGPGALTVIRAGAIVHGRPAVTTATTIEVGKGAA